MMCVRCAATACRPPRYTELMTRSYLPRCAFLAFALSASCNPSQPCDSGEIDVYAADGCFVDVQVNCVGDGGSVEPFFTRCSVAHDYTSPTLSFNGLGTRTCVVTLSCADGTSTTLDIQSIDTGDGCALLNASGPACSAPSSCTNGEGSRATVAQVCVRAALDGSSDAPLD